jgi:hypothetical protein
MLRWVMRVVIITRQTARVVVADLRCQELPPHRSATMNWHVYFRRRPRLERTVTFEVVLSKVERAVQNLFAFAGLDE